MRIPQLVINNSYSRIQGLSPKLEKELRNKLSYTVGGKNAMFSRFGPKKSSLLDKRGEFPTGLLTRVLYWLSENVKDFDIDDQRRFPTPTVSKGLLNPVQPYLWQIKARTAASENGRGIIEAPTGTGKSLALALVAAEFRVQTLVVVPTVELKKQLTADLLERFSDTSWIDVENIDSTALKTPKRAYGLLIIDEAHHSAAKTYRKLNKTAWKDIAYRIFMTATAFRNDPEEQILMDSLAGEIIYSLSYKEAVKNNYIVPIESYYLEMTKRKTEAFTYAEVYSELVVKNIDRNTTISELLINLEASLTPTLCLVREVAHGKTLSDMSGVPFVSGQNEDSRKYIKQFNEGKITALIGTTGVLGEGIDTKPAQFIIIAGLGKAKSQFMQQVGRVVRRFKDKTSGKVILIKDNSHKFLLRHFKEQCTILKEEYNSIPLKLDV